jgi:omega-amidase
MNATQAQGNLAGAGSLTVALGEYDTGWHDPAGSLSSAHSIAESARSAGADLLILPEMCATGFTMDAETFAEPPDGPSVRALSRLAAEQRLWIVAGLALKREGRYLNSALTFAPDGSLVATYDKQRLFGFASEPSVYSAGTEPCIVRIGGLSLAVFVCFDLRFPELFKSVGAESDALVVIANWPTSRQQHWEVLTQARAIENQCYMIAVNRLGTGGGLAYSGGSVVLDPWGTRIDAASDRSRVRVAQMSRAKVEDVRKALPLDSRSNDSNTPTIAS